MFRSLPTCLVGVQANSRLPQIQLHAVFGMLSKAEKLISQVQRTSKKHYPPRLASFCSVLSHRSTTSQRRCKQFAVGIPCCKAGRAPQLAGLVLTRHNRQPNLHNSLAAIRLAHLVICTGQQHRHSNAPAKVAPS